MDDTLNVVKSWIMENRPGLKDASIHIDTQSGNKDLHFAKSPLLPGVTDDHVNENDYQVATINDSVKTDDGFTIAKIIKLTVKDNAVMKVLESK